jgi:lysophospholipase L1-like esterase
VFFTSFFARRRCVPREPIHRRPGVEALEDRTLCAVLGPPPISPALSTGLIWRARANEILSQPHGNPNVVFLGDSIFDRFQNGAGAAVWLAHIAPLGARDLAASSSTTQNVLWLIDHGVLDGTSPSAVVLLIGTNNFVYQESPVEVAAGVQATVAAVHSRLPRAGIIVLGLLPKGKDPHGKFRWEIPMVNRLLAPLGALPGIRFLDVGSAFLNPDGTIEQNLLPDYTHPSAGGYQLLVDALRPLLKTFLGRDVP